MRYVIQRWIPPCWSDTQWVCRSFETQKSMAITNIAFARKKYPREAYRLVIRRETNEVVLS